MRVASRLPFLLLSWSVLVGGAEKPAATGPSPADAPGAGVELGGQRVPRDKFIVFLLIGHSNSMGYGTRKDPHDKEGMERLWYLSRPKGKKDAPQPLQWVPSREGVIQPESHASPGHRFLRHIAKAYPGYHFGFAQVSNPGTVIRFYLRGVDGQKNEKGEALDLRPELEEVINKIKGQATFGGVLCFLGYPEGKAKYGTVDVENYKPNFLLLQKQIRELTGVANLPFIVNHQELNAPEYRQYSPQIEGWILEFPSLDPARRTLLSPERPIPQALFGDNWHYNVRAYEIWASYGVRKYQDLALDTWFKDGQRSLVEPVQLETATAAAPAQWPANREKQVFHWEDNTAARLLDPAGQFVRMCAVRPSGLARFSRSDGMLLDGGQFILLDVDKAIAAPVEGGEPLSLVLSLKPALATPHDSVILAMYNEGGKEPVLTLSQLGGLLKLRMRTVEKKGERAMREWDIALITPTVWNQVALTVNRKARPEVFVDGKPCRPIKDYSTGVWTRAEPGLGKPAKIVFGADAAGGRSWTGEIEHVAMWRRDLTPEEAAQNCAWSRQDQSKISAVQRAIVRAKLIAKPDLSKADKSVVTDETYPRMLAIAHWKIEEVVIGKLDAREILVAHWARLDQKPVPAYVGLTPGESVLLELEPIDSHPEVSAEQQLDTLNVDPATPRLLDVRALGSPPPQAAGR